MNTTSNLTAGMRPYRYILAVLLLLLPALTCFAQQIPRTHVRETDYLLYLPDDYAQDTLRTWPLLVYLHGSGVTGSDVEMLRESALSKLIEEGVKYPFVIISPQSREQGWNPRELKYFIEAEAVKYRIDTDRIYLSGYSMGGTGTWDLSTAYPEFFAAIVPVCGRVSQEAMRNVFQLRHTAVWCFHGAKDPVIDVSQSITMIDSLHKYNPSAKLTVYPEADHSIWRKTYSGNDLVEWLLKQKRYVNREIVIPSTRLEEYASFKYAIPGQDAMAHFTVEDGGLRLWVAGEKGEIIRPMGDDTFFLNPDSRKYLVFHRSPGGEIVGLSLYEYDNLLFCRNVGLIR